MSKIYIVLMDDKVDEQEKMGNYSLCARNSSSWLSFLHVLF